MASFARLSQNAKAKCYALRNPPKVAGHKAPKKMPFHDIALLVKKTDGTIPTEGAVRQAVQNFKKEKKNLGRKSGSRATTKEEDKVILKIFKKVRPDGCGVDARKIHNALPKKLKKKIGARTVIRRLAEKGYKARNKLNKSCVSEENNKKRIKFCKAHVDKSAQDWKNNVQAVGDIKEFTYYPKELRARFKQLRSPWTYMTEKEMHKPAFLRPKRWFKKSDYKKVRKQKIFGMVTSTGKKMAVPCPTPMTGESFANLVRTKISPFLKRAFPRKDVKQILLDGEKIFKAPPSKAALKDCNITILANWPAYSPDLNPQENVWPWAEKKLRELEKTNDTFEDFGEKCVQAVKAYPDGAKLIASMPKRMTLCIEGKGAMIPK